MTPAISTDGLIDTTLNCRAHADELCLGPNDVAENTSPEVLRLTQALADAERRAAQGEEARRTLDAILSCLPNDQDVERDQDAVPLGQVVNDQLRGVVPSWLQRVASLKATEQQARREQERQEILAHTASRLLTAEDPLCIVKDLCRKVMTHLDCHAFFNFIADPLSGRLRLNAWAGISDEEASSIEWLDYGVAICGCVAQGKCRIVAEDILHSSDDRASLVRSYGIQAYCCHPLLAEERLIGTLSFGTKTRSQFSSDDIELMRAVADQVASAMQRVLVVQQLSLANAQLEQSNAQKNQFLAVLSHELRNPLTPIRNSLYILERSEAGGPQARRAQQVIERQLTQLTRLVDDLLDLNRLTLGKLRMQKGQVDLVELVRNTAEDHRSLFEKAALSFHVEIDASTPLRLEGDAARLSQAVGNLLCNAAKFTPPGGRVSLCLHRNAERAAVEVRDTGIGIAQDTLARLFQPFVQADISLDRSRGGLGLGLFLVTAIADMHGGTIEVRSEGLGKGSEFTLRLPLDATASVNCGPVRASEQSLGQAILIIEDNVDAADSLRDLLDLCGHSVEVAYTGAEGVAKARSLKPRLVFCDIGLPGLDGYAVVKSLRNEPALSATRWVAMSGYAHAEDVKRARDAGFDEHLAKPTSLDRLQQILGTGEG